MGSDADCASLAEQSGSQMRKPDGRTTGPAPWPNETPRRERASAAEKSARLRKLKTFIRIRFFIRNTGFVMTLTAGLALAVSLVFAPSAAVKIIGVSASLAIRDRLKVPSRLWQLTGALEAAGVVGALIGLAYRPVGVAATTGLTGLMLGALASRLRVRDALPAILLDIVVLALVTTTLVLYSQT
ncbi:DoxX family protein [Streptomyces griseorubiginosus]|uniref:DoxX family protein n=1 Tax=Streptomyces griseorubiginosus TaxID=67304 RepID=UPI0036EA026A